VMDGPRDAVMARLMGTAQQGAATTPIASPSTPPASQAA
jgi:hypothetical protein